MPITPPGLASGTGCFHRGRDALLPDPAGEPVRGEWRAGDGGTGGKEIAVAVQQLNQLLVQAVELVRQVGLLSPALGSKP